MPVNYKTLTVKRDGETYHFVTRGRSKPFTDEEADKYFASNKELLNKIFGDPDDFRVEGPLRRIFAQDLRLGLSHCSRKYGKTEQAILREAKRLFPTQNLEVIVGKGD